MQYCVGDEDAPLLLKAWLHVKKNNFSHRGRLSEIISFQRVKTCLKLFQNYFTVLLQFMNNSQHVHCR